MSKNFTELNRKMRLATVLRFLVISIALGMLAFSVMLLSDKVSAKQPNYFIALFVGAGAALVFAVVSFSVCFPTEKRIAKRIDGKLELGEKVQTMVEFKHEQSDMLEIQRQDTEERLAEASEKKLRGKRIWVSIILPVVAAAVLATSLALPVRTLADDPDGDIQEENDEWSLDDWHVTAVRALIEEVKASEMAEDGRNKIVSYLETMLSDLEFIKSKKQMKQTVTSVMVKISAVADGMNSYTSIIRSLRSAGSDSVTKFSEAIGSPADPIIESKLQDFKSSFKKETAKAALADFSNALEVAVKNSSAKEDDALYAALLSYTKAVSEFAETAEGLTQEDFEKGLTDIFEQAAVEIGAALDVQNVNRDVTDNTNNRLMIIFGISWAELPDGLKYPQNEEMGSEDGEYDEKEDDKVTGGGLGSGEVVYGSDDAVYDPEKGTKVNYGEVINSYDAKKATELEERPLDDDMKEAIGDYFDSLYYKQENK